jgi:hypothetical protein
VVIFNFSDIIVFPLVAIDAKTGATGAFGIELK